VRELGRIADIPVQEFVVRNDCGCGRGVLNIYIRIMIFTYWLNKIKKILIQFYSLHLCSTIGPAISAKTGIRVVDAGSRFTIFFIWLHWFSSCIKKQKTSYLCLPTINRIAFSCLLFTVPQLSMHSCREVMGIADLSYGVDMFTAFYNHFRSIDDNLSKDIV